MTPEKKVQSDIEAYLKERSILFFRRQAGGGNSYHTGLPDLYGCHNSIHFEIEVKSDSGKLSSAQLKWKSILTLHGAIYIIAPSLEKFKTEWKKYFKEDQI